MQASIEYSSCTLCGSTVRDIVGNDITGTRNDVLVERSKIIMIKKSKRSGKLWWLTPLILCLAVGVTLALVLCDTYYVRYKNVDENVGKWNAILANNELSTKMMTGEVKSKSKYEGEHDKTYTFIVTDDECPVSGTVEEYESINVGDTITYYLSSGVYPREVVTDEDGRCTGAETVTMRATSATVAEQEALSAIKDETKACPAEWVFCSKHRVGIYVAIFAVSMLLSWLLLSACWDGLGTGKNCFEKRNKVSPEKP